MTDETETTVDETDETPEEEAAEPTTPSAYPDGDPQLPHVGDSSGGPTPNAGNEFVDPQALDPKKLVVPPAGEAPVGRNPSADAVDTSAFLVGGGITQAGRDAGLTDDDVVGGQLTPGAQARLLSEAHVKNATSQVTPAEETDDSAGKAADDETPDDSWTKAELVAYADEHGIDSSGTKADILERINAEPAPA